MAESYHNLIGVVTSGSLLEGLTARLDAQRSIEEIRVGQFVVIQGEKNKFFSLITDIILETTNQTILKDPPVDASFLSEILKGTATYGKITLQPQLMLPNGDSQRLQPVKTIPSHFAQVCEAEKDDFQDVFATAGKLFFEIGKPLDMNVPVHINLERFVERSNGVFGKSGTGKSFLTRLLLCGTILADVASNLIFDMHNEYGWESKAEDGTFVKGLRQLFGDQVYVCSLDVDASRQRGVKIDQEVTIGLDQIEVEDILLLQNELNLSSTATETCNLLEEEYKEEWLVRFLQMDTKSLKDFAETSGAHPGSLGALRRKLKQIAPSKRSYIKEKTSTSVIDWMIKALSNGKHVVLEFGRHDNVLDYMLVANLITRRIRESWKDKTETYLRTKKATDRPRQLMISIEEAHNFLNSAQSGQTIFGKIAREMRKYHVTLLVVDQRPSSIDDEVLSQLGTRVTALLNDDRDIDAVFAGVSGGRGLKAILASLDSRQQALILGHAVPMPIVVQTRSYDEEFYKAMGKRGTKSFAEPELSAQEEVDELFPD